MQPIARLRRSTLPVLAACLLAGLFPPTAHATTIPKGPYLLNVTTTAITVAWQTDSASDSRVTFTPAGGATASSYLATAVTGHQVRLTGLTPDTSYTYSVTSSGGAGTVTSATGSFRTAPSGAAAFRFAVYGDNRTQPSVHAQVANGVAAAGARFVFDSGDLSADSTNDGTFQNEFFVPAKGMLLTTPLYPALGNHEGNSSLYYQYFAGLPTGGGTGGIEWYSFDYGSAHFIVLDTNVAYAPGSAQYTWLVSDLQKTTATWRFVTTHHPAYSSGTHGSDANVDAYLVPLFETYHVDAVFHGHDHLYERSLKNGVNYFVSGGGGAPLYAVNSTSNPFQKYALASYHYLTVDVSGNTATIQAHSTSGTVFDAITITHTATVAPVASFSTNPTSGPAPLTVYFSDTSTNSPTAWAWNFGDGGASAARNPSHVYSAAGSDTVTLTASNSAGSGTAKATVTVQPPSTTHTLTVKAAASPTTVVSKGVTSLTGTATDSQGHSIATWSWSDGGAGGVFSSPTAQNPSYTAPANTSGASRLVTLTVTAKCAGTTPLSASGSVALTVQPAPTTAPHVTVTATASPTTVASGGTSSLSMQATDSQGHTGLAYQWSDNGAGGSFSSPTASSTSYTAPANTTSAPRTVSITATATCRWQYPWATGSTTLSLTVNATGGAAHTVTVTATANPTTVASGGTTALTATAADSQGHTSFAWKWSDGGAGGAFSSATAQSPSYTAPANTSGSARPITLTVTATCSASGTPVTGSKSATLTVNSTATPAHVTVTAAATPSTVASGGTVALSMTAKDLYGHTGFGYQWSDNGAGGTFSSATAQNPSYRAPSNTSGAVRTVTLTATAICKWQYPWAQGSAPVSLTVNRQ